jgi:hypothetical protein
VKWTYYIPHVWDSPEQRTTWEDVWLLPEDGSNDGASYWFTLNALRMWAAGVEEEFPQDPDDPLCGFGGSELARERNLQLLGGRDYFITPALDMVARVDDFDLHELLEWTKVFIREHLGDPAPSLVEGRYEDFAASNTQAREMDRIRRALEAGVPEEEVLDYRPRDPDAQDP